MRTVQIRAHEQCRQHVAGSDLIPRQCVQARLGHRRRHAVETKLEDDEQQREGDEHRRLLLGAVHHPRRDEPARDESRIMEHGVHRDVEHRAIGRRVTEYAEQGRA